MRLVLKTGDYLGMPKNLNNFIIKVHFILINPKGEK